MKLGFEAINRIYNASTDSWDQPLPALDSDKTLVTCFGSADIVKIQRALDELRQAYPKACVLGCSTAGEIYKDHVLDESLSVGVAHFASTTMRQSTVELTDDTTSFDVGSRIARELDDPGLRAIFILSEGLNVNGTDLVRGVNSVVSESVVVTGGLAGDGTRFEKTWVLAKEQAGPNIITAVGFYGANFEVYHGSQGGWDKFGPVRKVTRSQSNVLHELDGEPALAVYEKYLGPRAKDLPSSGLLFPLAIRPPGEDKVLVRTLLAIDRDAQTLTFAGDIPEGSTAQLMKAHLDRLIDGAEDAASALAPRSKEQKLLTIAVSCVGRRLVLGERTEDELEAILSTMNMPQNVLVGFYSYGELSPVGQGCCDLHNQTMTITSFGERALNTQQLKLRISQSLSSIKPPEKKQSGPPSPKPYGLSSVSNKEHAARNEELSGENLTLSYDLLTHTWSDAFPQVDSEQTLVLVFGTPNAIHESEAIKQIYDAFPTSHVLGCSGAGEIMDGMVHDDLITVVIKPFLKTRLKSTFSPVKDAAESFDVGKRLARELDDPELKAIFILSEGLNVNGSDLVRGVNSVVSKEVVVTGGLAGDGTRFEKTWILAHGKASSMMVSAVGFYGDHVMVSHGSQGGWDSFGPVRTVTRSEGNVLYELDGKPALALYKTYLGEKAKELPSSGLLFPISLLDTEGGARNVVRTLLSVDHEAQSLTFAGDVPQGAKVQLMKAHFDRLVDGAQNAAELANKQAHKEHPLAIAVSCVGRRLVLGAQTEDELDVVLDTLPESTTMAGFYSYGELSPVGQGSCDLHNQTMTLTVFGESPVPLMEKKASPRSAMDDPTVVLQRSKQLAATNPPPARAASREASTPPPMPIRAEDVPDVRPAPSAVVQRPEPREAAPTQKVARTSSSKERLIIPVQGAHIKGDNLQTDISSNDYGVTIVRLQGKMDEKFQGAQLGRKLKGLVILDLAEVFRITSFGVREWLTMLKEAKGADEIYLARCSDAIANQLATIRAFAGNARVISFFAPYRCEHCDMSFNALLDAEYDSEELEQNIPPTVECLRCKKETTGLDEDAEYFFSFVSKDSQPPAFVREAIEDLPAMQTSEPVEKLIQDDCTLIRINTELNSSIRWRRLILDVEGRVLIDLSGVDSVTREGAKLLVANMKQSADEADFELVNAPFEVLEQLYEERFRVVLDRVEIEGERSDGQRRRVYTSMATFSDEVLDATPFVIEEGGERLDLSAQKEMLWFLTNHTPSKPKAAADNVERQPASFTADSSDELEVAPPQSSSGLYLKALPVILLVVILGAVIVWKVTSKDEQSGEALSVSSRGAAMPIDGSAPSAKEDGKWSTGASIQPAWADISAVSENGTLFLTGKGSGETEGAALEQATKQARVLLISQLQERLKGEPIYQVVQSSVAAEESVQLAILDQQMQGAQVALKRTDHAFRKAGGEVELVARYAIQEEGMKQLIEHYAQRVDTPDVSFGVRFPTLPGPEGRDVVVVKSTAQDVQSGDVILSESQESMYTLSQLRARVEKEGPLELVLDSKGVAKTAKVATK